jgi:hypothetical protein
MAISRRELIAAFGLGSTGLVADAGVAAWSGITPVTMMPSDAVDITRRRNALAFVQSVNVDLALFGLPPLSNDYIRQALA